MSAGNGSIRLASLGGDIDDFAGPLIAAGPSPYLDLFPPVRDE